MSCSRTRECKKKKRPFSPFPPISSAIPGFFKIMIGYFRDALFIPPKFAQTLGGIANKNFYLEDCAGNCWMVKLIATDDGSLVFEEGWRDFVLNHSISVGEIVVFKHISIAVFTVQIYGTSGCERVEFQGKENGYILKRKRTKNEITSNILCQSKAQKRYETSEGKHNATVKETCMKDRVEKTFPCCLAGNETAARKYVTRSAREHTYSLEESPPHDDGHRKLRNSSTMSHLEAPNKIIDQGKKIEESGRNSPIVLSDDDEEMDEVIMIKDYSYVDKSNGGAKSSAKEHFKSRKENLAVDKRSANRCFLTTERKSSMMHKEVMEMTPSASVYPGTSQIKHNSRSTNTSAANEGKMSVHEKAVAVEHNKDRKEGVAACNKSNNRCLSVLDKKNSVIDKILVCKQEVIEITPFTSAPPQILETRRSSQDANRLEVNGENTSHEHNSPKSPKTVSAEDCTKVETRIKIENKCEIVTHPLADERLPMVGCSQGQNIAVEGRVAIDKIIRNTGSEPEEFINNLHDEEVVGNSYGRPEATSEVSEDEDGNLVSKEFVRNALVMGEGVCYTAVHDSENKLEANVDARVGVHTEDRGQHLTLAEEFAHNPFVNERMSMVDCSQGQNIAAEGQLANDKTIRNNESEPEEFTNNLDDEEFAGNSYGRLEGLTPEFVEDEDVNVVSKEFSCKSLVMGEGMCYDAAQDSKDKLEVNVDDSIGLHAEDEAKNLILAEEFTQNCLVMGEGSSYPVDENSKDKLEERIDYFIDLGAEDEGGNLIVPKEVVSKSLVRGEDMCYNADDSKDELETRIDASIDLHAAKGECNVLDADEVEVITKRLSLHENNPELPSSTLLLNYNVDSQGNLPPPCKGIINCDQSEGNLGNGADPSQATTVKRSPLVMAVVSDCPKDPTTMDGDPLPSGIIPGELPEMDAEKVDPCSQGILAVVKTEIMNSIDFPSLKNVEFSTTVSLVSQSWLLLPEKLPAHLFKKRCLRKVVLLQDPSMNLWPVLYHEGFNFIGFVGGWEDFSIANNLQQGDTCQIEYVSASEPTFKVQLSNVHNST